MIALAAFAEAVAKSLRTDVPSLRIRFTLTLTSARFYSVRCSVGVHNDIPVLYGSGEDESAAMQEILDQCEQRHAATLKVEIERLETEKHVATIAAEKASRARDAKEKELRRTEERAARAAKAFQRALVTDDDDAPRLGKGGDDGDEG